MTQLDVIKQKVNYLYSVCKRQTMWIIGKKLNNMAII